MQNLLKKLTSRKFLAALAGVATGLAMVFGVDETTISTVAGAVTTVASLRHHNCIKIVGSFSFKYYLTCNFNCKCADLRRAVLADDTPLRVISQLKITFFRTVCRTENLNLIVLSGSCDCFLRTERHVIILAQQTVDVRVCNKQILHAIQTIACKPVAVCLPANF